MKSRNISQPSYSATVSSPSLNASKKRPKLGYVMTLLGSIVILISALVYLVLGNAEVGVIGIVFAILAIWFGQKAYTTVDQKDKRFYGIIPMFIGFFVMIATGTLMSFDMAVLIGGFLMTVGGVAMTSGK